MPPPSPSQIAAARIPKITDLREQLHYGDAKLARCFAFTDDLRVFRRRFSVKGLRGTDLWDWKSPEHHDALRHMTASFLDKHGYGEIYWPSDPTSPNFNLLQYSQDRIFITRTMRQLIFRLNLQQHRNIKYKKKEQQPDPPKTTVQSPIIIDLEAEDSPTTFGPIFDFPAVKTETSSDPRFTHAPIEQRASVPSTKTFEDNATSPLDVYEIHTSPDSEFEPAATKRKLVSPNNKRPIPKRSKIEAFNRSEGQLPKIHLEQAASKPPRASPRTRKTVQRPDYADIHGLNQAIAAQAATAELASDCDHDVGARRPTAARQIPEDIDGSLDWIRVNQPLVTDGSVPPSPVVGLAKAAHNPSIDPSLERILPSWSTSHQSRPWHSSSTSSTNRVQQENQPLPSPASTTYTLETAREIHQRISASPVPLPVSHAARISAKGEPEPPTTEPSRPSTASSAPPKSSIDFNYLVILTRAPLYQYKTWNPRGHFLEKILSELVDELPFDNKANITGLTIRLEGPGVAVEETLSCDEDAKFETTKSRFLRMVKMCLRNHTKANPGKTLVMNFEIEAVREGDVEVEDYDDDDIVF